MKAIGTYVLIKMNKIQNITKGGIILTGDTHDDILNGVVESIGSKAYIENKDGENIVGKTVLFEGTFAAGNLPFKTEEGEDYMITDFSNIMVVL